MTYRNGDAYPAPVAELSEILQQALPGLNRRSARQSALLLCDSARNQAFNTALVQWTSAAKYCNDCHSIDDRNPCRICSDPNRQRNRICVVTEQSDLLAISGLDDGWNGLYHVLKGTINPTRGISPEAAGIPELLERCNTLCQDPMSEVILATGNDVAGNLTAQYIAVRLQERRIPCTILARGLAPGSRIAAQPPATIRAAFTNREPVS